MKSKNDQLLEGAIDLHYHCYPEFSYDFQARLDDREAMQDAQRAGMLGIVLKSHIWPTVGRTDYLRSLVPGFQVFSSITLNISSGGLNPWALEMAAAQGARVVWMPTWSSVNALKAERGVGYRIKKHVPSLQYLGPKDGLSILDATGQVLEEVKEILAIAQKNGLVVSTGHLSPEESLKLAQEAANLGLTRLVFGHPLASSVGASMDMIRNMAKLGFYIELTALNAFFHTGDSLKRSIEIIREIGPEKCLLTSDCFGPWVPPAAEMLRMLSGALLEAGIEEEAIRQMLKINPAKLLDLPY